jgi:dephospho-CoA kinase
MQRLMQRAKMTEADARSRIQNQWPDEKKIPLADYIINNTSSDDTYAKVIALHEVFVTLNKDR